jgi:hypothetical protein
MKNFILLLGVATLAACVQKNNNAPDVSKLVTKITVNRFDQDFFALDTNQLTQGLQQLKAKHGSFVDTYINLYTPIQLMVQQGQPFEQITKDYFAAIKPLHDSINAKYANANFLADELAKAFAYMKYYFPQTKTPVVYTTVEAFNPDELDEIYGTVYFNDTLTISLQMYAGAGSSLYDPQKYPEYISRRFTKEYITRNAIKTMLDKLYPTTLQQVALLDQVIDAGKRMYVLKNVLPFVQEEIILAYTAKQLKDCEKGEKEIWMNLLENNYVYSTEPPIIREYLGENPFTKAFGAESPGNIGAFVGLKIVESYMKRFSNTSFNDLMKMDTRKLFNEAKYKP